MIWCSFFAENRPNSWEITCWCLMCFHSRVHRHKGRPLRRLNWTILGRQWLWTLPEIKCRCWKGRSLLYSRGYPGGSVVKNPPASAGDLRDVGSIPESERSSGGGHGNPLQYLASRIPWTEEPGRLLSTGSQSQKWLSDWAPVGQW